MAKEYKFIKAYAKENRGGWVVVELDPLKRMVLKIEEAEHLRRELSDAIENARPYRPSAFSMYGA
jgi:hypothetical protein